MTIDPWGSSQLHHAAATPGSIDSVKAHISAGADVNAYGAYGLSPLISAAVAGHDAACSALTAAGAKPRVGPLNEPSWRGLLANTFGLERSSRYGPHVLSLNGCLAEGVGPTMAQAFAAFCKEAPLGKQLDEARAQKAASALQGAATAVCADSAALAQQAWRGDPVIILSGWRGHSIWFVLLGDCAYRIDRLALVLGRRWCKALLMHSQKGMQSLIERLRRIRRRSWFRAAFAFGMQGQLYRRGEAHEAFVRRLESLNLKRQKHPNCAVAAAKATVGLLIGWALPDAAKMTETYKQFTTFWRLYVLRAYITRHRGSSGADVDLVHACIQRLHQTGRLTRVPPEWSATLHADAGTFFSSQSQ